MSTTDKKQKGFVYYFMSFILPAIVSIFVIVFGFGIVDIDSCKVEDEDAQYGYEKAVKELESGLYVPSSLKITEVYCYVPILSDRVDYVYKICFSAENRLGDRVNGVEYFGCKGLVIFSYGEDSSEFDAAKRVGSEIKIRKNSGCS
ncbi:MAG: hypothetical protein IJA97_06535 [Clostridia bacterium]|nr:hypothetical protein [Clostridia bacterium]